jgi:tetratricopeptide (TPR) repeat protein
VDLDPLLAKLEQLAPRFGRASGDLAAIVTRGRGGDYKGVMQGCRLVVEMLLRAIVTTELKQTPGKAMLDELITKFRQQANAGVIPTNVLAHMGTVQAWGNLSSHDHAGSLSDEGVHVGPEEVATSLNSMVAILGWYAGKYRDPDEPKVATSELVKAQAGGAPPKKSSTGLVVAVAALAVAGLAAGATLALRPSGGGPRVTLDAFYAAAHEPLPPAPCRTTASAERLAAAAAHLGDELPEASRAPEAEKALALLDAASQDASPERAYWLGRAQLQAGKSSDAALALATKCDGFAAAENLAGRAALAAQKVDEADRYFGRAMASHPDFMKPRYNRALIRLKSQQVDEAITLLTAVIADNPSSADAHFWLAVGYENKGLAAEAKAAYCRALELGKTMAAERCKR